MTTTDTAADTTKVQWHKVRPWALVLLLLAALACVVYWFPEPDRALAFLKALAWPTVAAVTLYWLREPLREKFAQLARLSAAGAEMEFLMAEATEDLENSLAASAPEVIEQPQRAADAPDVEVEEGSVGEVTDRPKAEVPDWPSDEMTDLPMGEFSEKPMGEWGSSARAAREAALSGVSEQRERMLSERAAVEKIVRDSAEWGFRLAKAGAETLPNPSITWTRDGRPRVRLTTPPVPLSRERLRQIAKKRQVLVDEIENFRQRIDGLKAIYVEGSVDTPPDVRAQIDDLQIRRRYAEGELEFFDLRHAEVLGQLGGGR